jgi:hypothetical protein
LRKSADDSIDTAPGDSLGATTGIINRLVEATPSRASRLLQLQSICNNFGDPGAHKFASFVRAPVGKRSDAHKPPEFVRTFRSVRTAIVLELQV